MAKTSGLGSAFFVGTADISGDTQALSSIETSRALLDVTGIDKSAFERIPGLKDGKLTFTSFWNTALGQAFLALSAMPTTDVMVTYLHSSGLGDAGASMVAKQLNYAPARGQDGSLIATVNADANGFGLEWGELATTGKQLFASGTVNGTAIDFGAVSTLFGAAAYLHVFSLDSGTPTVKLQDSADNSSFGDITGMAFTAITVPVTQRIQGAINATVQRYVRINVAGTYANLTAAVIFVRYLASPN